MIDLGTEIYEVTDPFPDPHPIPPLRDEDRVALTTCQQWIARVVAKLRQRNNNKVGAKATMYNDKTPYRNTLDSYGGEMGFGIHHNVFPSFEFTHYDRFDLWYPNKKTKTEVKTGDKRGSWLGVKDLPYVYTDPVAYYALMEGVFPVYWFIGFIRSIDIINDDHRRTHKPNGEPFDHPLFIAEHWELSKTISEILEKEK